MIRTFGNKKAIRDLFTFKAQDEALKNPWSNQEIKTVGNKKGHIDLSEILCNMCRTEDDEISEDISDSDEEETGYKKKTKQRNSLP